MAKKKKSDAPKVSKSPSIEAVSHRADELGMTYGLYVQSPQYIFTLCQYIENIRLASEGDDDE